MSNDQPDANGDSTVDPERKDVSSEEQARRRERSFGAAAVLSLGPAQE